MLWIRLGKYLYNQLQLFRQQLRKLRNGDHFHSDRKCVKCSCDHSGVTLSSYKTLRVIEQSVRRHLWEQVRLEIREFCKIASGTNAEPSRKTKSLIGDIQITQDQALALSVKSHTKPSPLLEKYCLLLSANAFYKQTAQDIKILTGQRIWT